MTETYAFKTTRLEIADALADAFGGQAKTREELVEAARSVHASTEVLLALASLPEDGRYANLRALWPDLPHVPVER
jgi:hypothetical protein